MDKYWLSSLLSVCALLHLLKQCTDFDGSLYVTLLESLPSSHLPTISNNNMADARACEVGETSNTEFRTTK